MGKFITFEGGEGSGKSTQVKLLAEALKARGHEVVITREPGGTELAEKIREVLVGGTEVEPIAEVLLNFAARTDHVEKVIKPALNAGKWVLCDRFFDSTYVYQGYAGGVEVSVIDEIKNLTLGGFVPDITFLLDIDPEAGLKRAENRGEQNRYEAKGLEFHRNVREGFLKLADGNSRIKTLDAAQDVEFLHNAIIKLV